MAYGRKRRSLTLSRVLQKVLDKCSAGRLPWATCRPEGLKGQVLLPEGTTGQALPVQDAEPRQFLAFEVFQASAAAGGNMAELVVGEPERAYRSG